MEINAVQIKAQGRNLGFVPEMLLILRPVRVVIGLVKLRIVQPQRCHLRDALGLQKLGPAVENGCHAPAFKAGEQLGIAKARVTTAHDKNFSLAFVLTKSDQQPGLKAVILPQRIKRCGGRSELEIARGNHRPITVLLEQHRRGRSSIAGFKRNKRDGHRSAFGCGTQRATYIRRHVAPRCGGECNEQSEGEKKVSVSNTPHRPSLRAMPSSKGGIRRQTRPAPSEGWYIRYGTSRKKIDNRPAAESEKISRTAQCHPA